MLTGRALDAWLAANPSHPFIRGGLGCVAINSDLDVREVMFGAIKTVQDRGPLRHQCLRALDFDVATTQRCVVNFDLIRMEPLQGLEVSRVSQRRD